MQGMWAVLGVWSSVDCVDRCLLEAMSKAIFFHCGPYFKTQKDYTNLR